MTAVSETVDSLGFLASLEGLPEQLAAAHATCGKLDVSSLPRPDEVDNIAVLGMGGSGIVGDVALAVGTATLPVPVVVLKYYRTPAFVGPGTLVFAISYSGDTEETIEMTRGAIAAGASVVTVSAGGELARIAEEHGLLHVGCPPGLMPRAAIGALVAPVFVLLFRMGMLPEAHAGLVKAQEQLARRRDRCKPSVTGASNPARALARRIGRTIPIVYGAGGLGRVAAYRWKCSMNENAKAPAYWNVYPELDHNEISGWGQHGDVTRQVFTIVELRHGLEHARLEQRMAATREMIEETVAQVITVEAEGEGRLAQLLDMMYLGDWVSAYVALDNDVDPGPIDAIAQLKAKLGK
jgi:glucose/mannose-6-phosphate isomerase